MRTRSCWLLAGWLAFAPILLAQSTVQEVVSLTVPVERKNVALAKAKALQLADRQALEQVTRRLLGAEAYQLTQALLEHELFGSPGQFVESKRVIHEFRNETLTEYSITLEQHFYRVRLLNALEKLGLNPASRWARPISVELRVSPDLQSSEHRTLLRKLTDRLNAFRVVVTRVKSTASTTPTTEPIHQLQFVRKTTLASSDESAATPAVFSLTLLDPEGGVLLKQQLSAGHQLLPNEVERLLDELILVWPRFHQKLSAAVRSNAQLTLMFNGRSNPVYERTVTQRLSAVGVDVRKLNLYALSADTTTFELTTDVALPKLYNGIRKTLKAGHTTPASTEASFQLIDFAKPSGPPTREVEFFRPTVEMNLWLKDLEDEFLPTRSLPQTDTTAVVFSLPTGQWTHDLIRSRSNMRIFKLSPPGAGVKVRLKWRVLGATKLLPQLVLANAEGAVLKKYRLRRRKEFSLPLKFGTHAFYLLKISDELGELAGQDGGFQFFNYEVGVFVEPEGSG